MDRYRGPGLLTPLIRGRRRLLPLNEPGARPAGHSRQHLNLVTLNTWKGEGDYPKRVAAMSALLAGMDADIILLQEVLAIPERGINTAFALARFLGMHSAYHPAREKPRRFGCERMVCQSGMAILSRAPIRGSSAVPLPTDARDGERIAQVALIDIGRPLAVLNVHLSHLEGARPLRQRQFAAAVHALGDSGAGPYLIGGDFNDYADEDWIASMAEAAGLSIENSRASAPDLAFVPTLTGPAKDGGPLKARCVDHILLAYPPEVPAPRATDLSHHGDLTASDHLAVRASIPWAVTPSMATALCQSG